MTDLKPTKMKTIANYTELELQVLRNCRTSEYVDASEPRELLDQPTWSWDVTKAYKKDGTALSLRGAMGSCVKKGLISCNGEGNEQSCVLTELGLTVLLENNLF